MKQARSKIVLEGAITEVLKNEYDRYLAVDELVLQVDNQRYLGSVTKEEAEGCLKHFENIQTHRTAILGELKELSSYIFSMVREEEKTKEQKKKEKKEQKKEKKSKKEVKKENKEV